MDGDECWHFKLFAERRESSHSDDRLFELWPILGSDASVLCAEFGGSGDVPHVWPVSGGLGSVEARGIVERILSGDPRPPQTVIQTQDFSTVLECWDVVSD
ncbi:hypothetical protein [Streptomyces sp. NBC_00094]|uniref:hypothetical protein n=1 Tax=Streptomyces sp. NBC_00094 TaxID=2903620 RepID=UPI002251F316|nr:hypothetical protein [Streptomyces sp. NBC_00094]MCX5392891.1 hypothetical protein [Streptomyces sp. NBC_00094]